MSFENPQWADKLNFAVTICDIHGTILYMNEKAQQVFARWGGKELIGKSLFPCHSEYSVEMIKTMIAEGKSNTYTIEKNGIRKLIHQTPWYSDGRVAGMVEISIEMPDNMPHRVR
ncbi:MAG TPA: PAS domain-containing protein [Salinivirgaceae bacterium]|nr:PAS domain-containing protein [Salinivirgaceae bacterium]